MEWDGMGPNEESPLQTPKVRRAVPTTNYQISPAKSVYVYPDGIKSRPPPNETKVNFTTI